MHVKLLTSEIKSKLPPLGAQDGKGEDATVWVKWFNPTGGQTWWVTEYDPKQEVAFAYVTGGHEDEWGYVSLQEISNVRVQYGLGIERDLYFTPKSLRECLRRA